MATKTDKATTSDVKNRAVLVTTEHKGVFFGYLARDADFDRDRKRIKLSGARNCLYWPEETRGFIGLATMGPPNGSRVGFAASALELEGVTSVVTVEPAAIERWESAPWR